MTLDYYIIKPSIAHDLAAAYAFQVIGRSYITRRELRRVVCPKLNITRREARDLEKDLVARGQLIPVPHGAYRQK